jgi:hypothetical protein
MISVVIPSLTGNPGDVFLDSRLRGNDAQQTKSGAVLVSRTVVVHEYQKKLLTAQMALSCSVIYLFDVSVI